MVITFSGDLPLRGLGLVLSYYFLEKNPWLTLQQETSYLLLRDSSDLLVPEKAGLP